MKNLSVILSIAFLASAAVAQSGSDKSLAKVRKAIEASNAIYSDLANKDDGSILSRYTNDACLLPPNRAPVCGHEKIAAFFKGGPKVHSVFTIEHIYGDGENFVTEESHYQLTDLSGNKLDEGKVVVIWKKTAAGWKMHRDMFSSDRPAKS